MLIITWINFFNFTKRKVKLVEKPHIISMLDLLFNFFDCEILIVFYFLHAKHFINVYN